MMETFTKIAQGIANPYTERWVDAGKPIVGYTCSFMPPEIFHAAGIMPYRLKGLETESIEIGDAYYGPYICTFPKCLLQLAGQGKYDFLSGAVISTGCDAMRRLDECWRKAGEDYPGSVPDFFHYFDVPHKTDAHALSWFENEIKKLISHVESHFHVTIKQVDLIDAIAVYNQSRQLISKLESIRGQANGLISGAEAFAVSVAGTAMPKEAFNDALRAFLGETENKQPSDVSGKKKIVVAGSINDDIELIRLIESSGAAVVADNLCFGSRSDNDLVDESGDPVKALASRYLVNSVCPRMFAGYQQRFDYLKDKVVSTHAQGIILQNIRFCDLHGSENGLFARDFENLGIPCLRLEREYGPLTETGRLKMRIEAFLESLFTEKVEMINA